MSQENTENIEKEIIQDENAVENQDVQGNTEAEMSVEDQLLEQKDKFIRLLPVLDDFDRAWAQVSQSEDEALVKGVELIHEKLKSTLMSKGLEVVEIKAGDAFDADFAEAITQIPAPTPKLKGKIVDVIEKGYKLGDKIIRFPKVILGN